MFTSVCYNLFDYRQDTVTEYKHWSRFAYLMEISFTLHILLILHLT